MSFRHSHDEPKIELSDVEDTAKALTQFSKKREIVTRLLQFKTVGKRKMCAKNFVPIVEFFFIARFCKLKYNTNDFRHDYIM